jgi:cobalt/nickel transport system permease protein
MQPIHLAIGMVEGLVTVAVISFVSKARPEILHEAFESRPIGNRPARGILLAFLIAALVTAGVLSWFASDKPDGLEWAIARITGGEELIGPQGGLHAAAAAVQEKSAFLPDYSLGKSAGAGVEGEPPGEARGNDAGIDAGTGAAGIIGGMLTLAIVFLSGFLLKRSGGTPSR